MRVIFVTFIVLSNIFPQCWVRTYNGPANDIDFATGLVLTNDGSIYVTGQSKGIDCDYDYCTIKYNDSGIEEWVRRYNGPANGSDCARAIAIDCIGNVYVTGFANFVETYNDIVTLKYNSNGGVEWMARYCGDSIPSSDLGSDIVCDTQGNVYVTGYSYTGPRQYPVTIKYDSNGVQTWAVKDTIQGWTVSIGLDDQGNIYTAGYQIVRDSARYSIIKYNSDGVIQWRAGDNIIGYAYKLKVSSEGDVFVTGASGIGYTGNWRWDIVTAKYNTSGQEQWVRRYDDSVGGWDEGHSLVLDNQGNVYVAGSSGTQPGAAPAFDYVTIKYSPSGNEEWIRKYGFESDDEAYDVVVDGQNNIYVGGYSFRFNNNQWNADATIMKYDFLGNLIWVARCNGPNSSAGGLLSLAIDEEGYLYGTGWAYDLATNYNYLTIKYPPTGPGISENLKDIIKCNKIMVNPNPFRKSVRFDFQIPNVLFPINIQIYNLIGRVVKTFKEVTTSSIIWDGKDDDNKLLPSGIYFVNCYSKNYQFTKKLIKQN